MLIVALLMVLLTGSAFADEVANLSFVSLDFGFIDENYIDALPFLSHKEFLKNDEEQPISADSSGSLTSPLPNRKSNEKNTSDLKNRIGFDTDEEDSNGYDENDEDADNDEVENDGKPKNNDISNDKNTENIDTASEKTNIGNENVEEDGYANEKEDIPNSVDSDISKEQKEKTKQDKEDSSNKLEATTIGAALTNAVVKAGQKVKFQEDGDESKADISTNENENLEEDDYTNDLSDEKTNNKAHNNSDIELDGLEVTDENDNENDETDEEKTNPEIEIDGKNLGISEDNDEDNKSPNNGITNVLGAVAGGLVGSQLGNLFGGDQQQRNNFGLLSNLEDSMETGLSNLREGVMGSLEMGSTENDDEGLPNFEVESDGDDTSNMEVEAEGDTQDFEVSTDGNDEVSDLEVDVGDNDEQPESEADVEDKTSDLEIDGEDESSEPQEEDEEKDDDTSDLEINDDESNSEEDGGETEGGNDYDAEEKKLESDKNIVQSFIDNQIENNEKVESNAKKNHTVVTEIKDPFKYNVYHINSQGKNQNEEVSRTVEQISPEMTSDNNITNENNRVSSIQNDELANTKAELESKISSLENQLKDLSIKLTASVQKEPEKLEKRADKGEWIEATEKKYEKKVRKKSKTSKSEKKQGDKWEDESPKDESSDEEQRENDDACNYDEKRGEEQEVEDDILHSYHF